MRESCAVRLTIRYMLMFVHRRDLEQSSVSRTLSSDRVRVCYAKSHLCILLFLRKTAQLIKYKNPVDFLILGGGRRREKNARKFFGFCTRESASVSEARIIGRQDSIQNTFELRSIHTASSFGKWQLKFPYFTLHFKTQK
jgi:hypothetical protein